MSCNDNQSFCQTDQTIEGNLKSIIQSDQELSNLLNKDDPLDFLNVSGKKITADIWEMIEKLLKATNTFGELGDRKFPSVTNGKLDQWPNDINMFLNISSEHYNNIVNILKKSNLLSSFNTVNEHSLVLGEHFIDLKNYIKKFKIDANRCDSCNISCYSDYSCNQGCNQGCSQGCGEVCGTNNQGGCAQCFQGCPSNCEGLEGGGGGCTTCESCVSCEACMSCQSCYGQGCSSCDIGCYNGYDCSRDGLGAP